MPLYKRQSYEIKAQVPPGLSSTTKLWSVRFTGEVFTEYQ